MNDSAIEFVCGNSRVDDVENVSKELETCIPTHVISFIGRTHGTYNGEHIGTIDYLEKPGKLKENIQDNMYGPLCLALLAQKYDIHFTYLGTGCIFNHDTMDHDTNGYTEESQPDFFGSSYSIVKGYTDRLMQTIFDTTALNVRIRMPITHEINPRNFITKITNYDKICSIPNSMTVLNELLPILIEMALNGQVGTVNLTNPGTITHNEILEMYKEIVNPDFKWSNFSIEEQNAILASKRSNNCLNTEKLEGITYVKDIKTSVRDIIIQMKLNEATDKKIFVSLQAL
jgi:dTDP-4-dehydrorhamnose reductase